MAIKKWRSYLLSWRFMIQTDQQSQKYLLERRVVTPMQQKWLIKLMGYDFVVEYKSGLDNKAADALLHHDEPSRVIQGLRNRTQDPTRPSHMGLGHAMVCAESHG